MAHTDCRMCVPRSTQGLTDSTLTLRFADSPAHPTSQRTRLTPSPRLGPRSRQRAPLPPPPPAATCGPLTIPARTLPPPERHTCPRECARHAARFRSAGVPGLLVPSRLPRGAVLPVPPGLRSVPLPL